jgi:adenine phosphoribosyltransferase
MKIDKVAGSYHGIFDEVIVRDTKNLRSIPAAPGIMAEAVANILVLEYGTDEMEMHVDAVGKGDRVVLVDDLIATGGTAEGAVKLLRQMGAEVLAACFIIDLPDLGGAEKLRKLDVPVRTLIAFGGH